MTQPGELIRPVYPEGKTEQDRPVSPAIKVSDFVYVSGQLPLDEDGRLVSPDIRIQTHQVMQNVLAILAPLGLSCRHIVKTTVWLNDLGDLAAFDEVYAGYFDDVYPARTVLPAAGLPQGAKVLLEAYVIDTLTYEHLIRRARQGCEACPAAPGKK